MTDHPLTEEAVAEFWNADDRVNGWDYMSSATRNAALSAFRAAFDAGREYERANPEGRPWEPLGKDDPVSVGDEVRRDFAGMTTIAVVGRARTDKNLYTAEGSFIGFLGSGTWHVRRAARELPTKFGAAIFPAPGHKTITATDPADGTVWRAREAVRIGSSHWAAVWRNEADHICYTTPGGWIDADTWQEDDA